MPIGLSHELTNVKDAFNEVLTQIYHIVHKKALEVGDDPIVLRIYKP